MKIIGENEQLASGTIAATIGMFDGVHLGHASLIASLKEQAKSRGLQSAVITFRQHPQVVLNPNCNLKMLMTIEQKVEQIASQGVDYTILLNFTRELSINNSRQFIKLLRDHYGVKLLVVGYDHHFGHDKSETFAHYVAHGKELGVEIIKAPEYLGIHAPVSSSIIRRLINSGKVDTAMHCMGHPHKLQGIVVHGFRNGHKIGFPTANVGHIDPTIILPHHGAYAVMVEVEGRRMQGMANVGIRPTLNNGPQVSVEVNIFDFDADIYDTPIAVEFIHFLRLEFKLGSIEELQAQLTRDQAKSRTILNTYNNNNNR